MKKREKRLTVQIFDKARRIQRNYLLTPNCKDIENKILNHTLNFIKCSELKELDENNKYLLHEHLIALYHKVNLVKHHMGRYQSIENRLFNKFKNDLSKGRIKEERVLIEDSQLTAELEAFLMQVKATLDILVGFLNFFYRDEKKKNPMKKQVTFENKGQNVIKDIEKYLRHHPEKKAFLNDLVAYLKEECIVSDKYEDGSMNWLMTVISKRDYIAHFSKSKYFAFQINNEKGKKKIVIPPLLTKSQFMYDALQVFYDNLLTFVQDFLALLLKPYLNKFFTCFTFDRKEVRDKAPKWYIIPSVFERFGGLTVQTPLEALKFFKADDCPLSEIEFLMMYMYYGSFRKIY